MVCVTSLASALAAAFNTMLEGMALRARDGASRSELEHVGTIAMRMLQTTASTPPKVRRTMDST